MQKEEVVISMKEIEETEEFEEGIDQPIKVEQPLLKKVQKQFQLDQLSDEWF